MADVQVEVRVDAGSRARDVAATYVVPHAWTDAGIAVEGGDVVARVLEQIDAVAEIPRVVRGEVTVSRR
jgi:hypothetical protein